MTARSILITGASSGIGRDAAEALHARGWRVFATCRKPADCSALEAQGIESFPLDYADEASVAAGAEEALSRTNGRLDAVFNNGAFASPGAVEDLPRAAYRTIFEANLFGPADLTRRLIPAMRAQGSGRIIMCSSVLGFTAARMRGAYNATKFAMEGLTDTLRLELAGTPLHVVLIQPGPIPTRIRENSVPHFERWIDWESSAQRDLYETSLIPRLYRPTPGPAPFELPCSAVTAKLIRALEAPRPRARYRVTRATHLMHIAKRLLPTRSFDRLSMRA